MTGDSVSRGVNQNWMVYECDGRKCAVATIVSRDADRFEIYPAFFYFLVSSSRADRFVAILPNDRPRQAIAKLQCLSRPYTKAAQMRLAPHGVKIS